MCHGRAQNNSSPPQPEIQPCETFPPRLQVFSPNLSLEVGCFQVSRWDIATCHLLLQLDPQPIHQLLDLCSRLLRWAGPTTEHPSACFQSLFSNKTPLEAISEVGCRGLFPSCLFWSCSSCIGLAAVTDGARELSQVWCDLTARGCETYKLSKLSRQIYQQIANEQIIFGTTCFARNIMLQIGAQKGCQRAKLPKSGKLGKSKNNYNFLKIVSIIVNLFHILWNLILD